MLNKLHKLYKKKRELQEQIRNSEIGNDSYYLSDIYKEHEKRLFALNESISELKNNKKLFNR